MPGLRSRLSILSDAECAQIHDAATHILANTGMRVEHERLLRMAAEAGYRVDTDAQRVWWTREEVDAALEERSGKPLGAGAPGMSSGGDTFTLRTGIRKYLWQAGWPKPRIPSLADARDLVVLADALESVKLCNLTSVGFQDVPLQTAVIHAWATGLRHLRLDKVTGHVLDIRTVPYLHDLWVIAHGSEEGARRQSVTSHCFVSTPLTCSRQGLEIVFALHDLGIPVFIGTGMPVVGANAPVSLCGTLALGIAEGMGGMMLSALFGVKSHYGSSPMVMDQSTGANCYNAVEVMMMAIAQQDLKRWYGFDDPTLPWAVNEADEAHAHGFVSGMQRGMSLIFGVLGGRRQGYAGFASSDAVSLPLMVLDDEFAGLAAHLVRGIRVTDELLAVPLIERLASGGSFLTDDEALGFAAQHFRDELFLPKLIDRRTVAAWLDDPDDAFSRAEDKVRDILATHDPHPLTEDQEREIQKVVDRADHDLAG